MVNTSGKTDREKFETTVGSGVAERIVRKCQDGRADWTGRS